MKHPDLKALGMLKRCMSHNGLMLCMMIVADGASNPSFHGRTLCWVMRPAVIVTWLATRAQARPMAAHGHPAQVRLSTRLAADAVLNHIWH